MAKTALKQSKQPIVLADSFTTASQLLMSFSCKVVGRESLNKPGLLTLSLRVIISGIKKELPLHLRVKASDFDEKRQSVKVSHPDAYTCNLLIGQALAKANDICINHRLADKNLTIESFANDYKINIAFKNDYLRYYATKLEARRKDGAITHITYKNELASLRKITRYKSIVAFDDISNKWVEGFDLWMKKLKNKQNTRSGTLKHLKHYINMAVSDGVIPYPIRIDYHISQKPGEITALTREEVETLISIYRDNTLSHTRQNVLRHFLFSCFSGLRISDIKKVTTHNIVNDTLVFAPHKSKRHEKIVKIPLTEFSKSLINTTGKLFDTISDQKANEALKDIADIAGIDKNISTHVARHTFATLFLELTGGAAGDVASLRELMGHSNIKDTLRYTHISDAHKGEQMKNFDKIGMPL